MRAHEPSPPSPVTVCSADVDSLVRDELTAVGAPEGKGPEFEAYLAELDADIELLTQIAEKADAGEDVTALRAQLDESAGVAALALDLESCAALANAVARTP